jgi:hypothetical protein
MEFDNNHFIIASRAYSLKSPTCTRVNFLVDTCVYNTYDIHVLSIRVSCGKPDLQIWHFNSVCICMSLRIYASLILKWDSWV